MSRHELISAYLSGEISRWTFVRGLMALGVSAVTAASYAVALRQSASAGHDFYDFYEDDPRKKKKKKKKGKKGKKGKGKKKKGKKKRREECRELSESCDSTAECCGATSGDVRCAESSRSICASEFPGRRCCGLTGVLCDPDNGPCDCCDGLICVPTLDDLSSSGNDEQFRCQPAAP